MEKIIKKLESINPWIIIGIFFLIYIILILKSPNILSGDEIFYYDQAKHMKDFELVNFENTQPFAFPAFLALLWTENVYILRIANAFVFCIAFIFLFKITEKIASRKTALIAILILGFSKFTAQYITTLHTEGLFVLAMLASIWYFLKLFEDKSWKNYLLLALWLSITLETRITGLAFLIIFPAYLLFFHRKHLNFKFILAIFIAATMFVPYWIHTGGKFFFEKAFVTRGEYEESIFALTELPSHVTIFFIGLLAFVMFSYHVKDKMQLFLFSSIIYGIFLLFPETILFTRHFFPVFVLLIPIVADAIVQQKNKILYGIGILLFIAFLISNIRIIPSLPKFYHQAYYIEVPETCKELNEFTVNGIPRKLPYFSQPSGSWEKYTISFLIDKKYNYLVLEYMDDELIDAILDENSIKSNFYSAQYSRQVANMVFLPGNHTLEITVRNSFNIGG
ncbi:MAG: glycosyltransferase family 39 protein, partial [Candidatus Pacearchaeota archaeon]